MTGLSSALVAAWLASAPQEPPDLAPLRLEAARAPFDEARLAEAIGGRLPLAARVLFELIASAGDESGLERAAAFARAARAAGAVDTLARIPGDLLALGARERAEWRRLYAEIANPEGDEAERERRLESLAERAGGLGDALLAAAAERSLGASRFFGGRLEPAREAI